MRRVIGLISLLLALSLSATAQIFGATQQEEQNAFGASAPSAAFQSTSALPASGSEYTSNPELNADGTAAYQGETYSPAKAARRPGGVRTHTPNPPDPTPLGDAVVPLMLLLGAYVCVRSFKKKRA